MRVLLFFAVVDLPDIHYCVAHVAQSVERFLGKEEVHRFDSGRGLHRLIWHFGMCLPGAAFIWFQT